MKLLFLLFAIVFIIKADHFLYESETGVAIQNLIGKEIDINIKFKKEFQRQPKVAYSIGLLDMNGITFTSEILNINQKGFTIRVKGDQLNQISYNWMATDNPLIHVAYIKSQEKNIQFPLESENIPIVNSFIVGATFSEQQNKTFKQQIVDINNEIIKLETIGAQEYKLCLIISYFDNSYSKNDLGLLVNDDTHPWLSQKKDQPKILIGEFELPNEIVDFIQIMGISGFESIGNRIRIEVNGEEIQDKENTIKVEFGTWDDSQIQSLSFSSFYIGNMEVQYYDENCAYLFSECYFQGQEIKICDNQSQLKYNGEVKSIKLPKDAIFTLYSSEEFEGKKYRIEQTQECMNSLYIGK